MVPPQSAVARIALLTTLAMVAFAGNSLLCRLAFKHSTIDAASFTSIRLLSGALVLALLVMMRSAMPGKRGSWLSALALFAYAAAFSFAYTRLPVASGALLLFGAVQTTMIGYGIWSGERLNTMQLTGLLLAFSGLIGLLLPGLAAPPLAQALLMIAAGIAWGIYSLRGKGAGDPTQATAGNFLRAVPITLLLSLLALDTATADLPGVGYAIASGAIASALGYALWYSVLPSLQATHAATVQLSVPVITAVGGILLLGEPVTLRLMLGSMAILGGIALVIHKKRMPQRAS